MIVFQRLQDWQDELGNTDNDVGALIGVSGSTINRAKRGLRPLKMEHQLALQKVTGITPAEWADFYAAAVERRLKPQKGRPSKKSLAVAGDAA